MSVAQHPSFSSDDYGPTINITNWLLMVLTSLAVLARAYTKFKTPRKFHFDDLFIILSLIFNAVLCGLVSLLVSAGLGHDREIIDQHQLLGFQKYLYASEILLLASFTCSRFSLLFFLGSITVNKTYNRLRIALLITLLLFSITTLLPALFQCSIPAPWAFSDAHCLNELSFWSYSIVSSFLFEVPLIILPCMILWQLQMPWQPRLKLALCFASRLCVVGPLVILMALLYTTGVSTSTPYSSWSLVVCALLIPAASIVTTCMIYLKPIFMALSSGMATADDLRRKNTAYSQTYASRSRTRSSKHINPSALNSFRFKTRKYLERGDDGLRLEDVNSRSISGNNRGQDFVWDGSSQTSHAVLVEAQ